MEETQAMRPTFFLLFSLLLVASVAANIAEFDDYWQKKAVEAQERARAAYNPYPEAEVSKFNKAVHRSFGGANTTRRRSLLGNKVGGECNATNPIDQCWMCQSDWANNRQALAKCATGFGRRTTGGLGGEIYVVTDPSDSDLVNPKPGTLRYGVIRDRPLWIIFAHDMVIRLQQELIINSNKTIDGRGADVHIANGAGFTIQFVHNVIIHGIHVHDIKVGSGGLIRDSEHHFGHRGQSDGTGISIFGSTNVWVDHVSMSNCTHGLINAAIQATAITISNCYFTDHDYVMLLGHADYYTADKIMQITVAFNHFGPGLVQRMPRCRFGYFHVVNNDYFHWLMYAIGGSKQPTIISQGNRFIASTDINTKEVTKRIETANSTWENWEWRSENDLLMNGAFFVQSGKPFVSTNSENDFIKPKPGTFVPSLTSYSGALNCKAGIPC